MQTSAKTLQVIRKKNKDSVKKIKPNDPFSLCSEIVLTPILSTAFYIRDQIQIHWWKLSDSHQFQGALDQLQSDKVQKNNIIIIIIIQNNKYSTFNISCKVV